ncbi:MAG: hypothetical protein HZA46_25405 [Planctomycetales bacterium]|nr:hypothetical protein [Planctomycetales bacterium]
MSTVTATSEAAILSRVIEPDKPALSPDAARAILSLTFAESDRQLMNELSEKARQGALDDDERVAIDNYERVGALLAIIQSKARLSLKHAVS